MIVSGFLIFARFIIQKETTIYPNNKLGDNRFQTIDISLKCKIINVGAMMKKETSCLWNIFWTPNDLHCLASSWARDQNFSCSVLLFTVLYSVKQLLIQNKKSDLVMMLLRNDFKQSYSTIFWQNFTICSAQRQADAVLVIIVLKNITFSSDCVLMQCRWISTDDH